jgi:hypothetical protein
MRISSLRSSAGFTFIGALVMVVILGIVAARAVVVWKTALQREKETELIFRGMQYMNGLRRWYWPKGIPTAQAAPGTTPAPGTAPSYPNGLPAGVAGPKELKDLLKGSGASPTPCIRKLFKDPMTGKEFEPIKGLDGRIVGVRSTSAAAPIKQANFPFDLDPSDFEGKNSYKDWLFDCTHWPKPLGTGAAQKIQGATPASQMNQPPGGSVESIPPPPPPPASPQ